LEEKEDGGIPGPACTLSGNRLGQATLRSSGSSWRVITVRTEPQGRKVRPNTDIMSTALGKEEISSYTTAVVR
jgi:hypothetical protein